MHEVGNGQFRLVIQELRELEGVDRFDWVKRVLENGSEYDPDHMWKAGPRCRRRHFRVLSDDDSARWLSTLHGPFDVQGLLADVEARLPDAGPQDRAVVPFSLRKALVEHGYEVPDIEFIASSL